jgi:hypothetical protein
MASLGLTNPVLKIQKSDDCVSLGIDYPGARCAPSKYKQDQLVLQCKRKKKKKNSIKYSNKDGRKIKYPDLNM